jgi:heavy metal sensor kinase
MRRRTIMFELMRARLTLWYTGVLALVLVLFAFATYAYLARAAQARTDATLADTANSLISNFAAESNDEEQSSEDAAAEVTRAFQFSDRQALVCNEAGRVVAASAPPTDASGQAAWPAQATLAQNLTGVLATAARSGHAYATVPGQAEAIRVYAVPVMSHGRTYTVVIAQSLHEQSNALRQVRRAFVIAVPLALLAASLGGYFLARKSLAPVVAMGDRAARIGAANLHERLPEPDARNELGRLAHIFNDLLARLDLSFEQQRRFMADASHELRTPVAIVCGESEVALSQADRSPAEYRESLAILHDQGRRLSRIVEDLCRLARADAGQYLPEITKFYLDETVSECVRAVRSLAVQHGLELHYQHTGEELLFRGDEGLLRRMILNLLDNAIKYTPADGHVRVDVTRTEARYTIRVADTGRGIPAAAQPHIFERFYRVDQARTHNGHMDGAGLGLSIASWIAELHGGRISLDRSDAQGSTFVISLLAAIETTAVEHQRI